MTGHDWTAALVGITGLCGIGAARVWGPPELLEALTWGGVALTCLAAGWGFLLSRLRSARVASQTPPPSDTPTESGASQDGSQELSEEEVLR